MAIEKLWGGLWKVRIISLKLLGSAVIVMVMIYALDEILADLISLSLTNEFKTQKISDFQLSNT